ncbi:MAG: ribosome biogenesis GTPase Der [Desulfonauticus sp.]|nr:ribosome biogenesis GTPase Der [Desulfonauticus sp.]
MNSIISHKTLPVVAIVGRPNVGKSTLFNRLSRQNKALTFDFPGVTRDNIYVQVAYPETKFILVDTGGLIVQQEQELEQEVSEQVKQAVNEADLILFVVDAKDGLLPQDKELALFLRQAGKPVLLVVNKVDGYEQEDVLSADFHQLGFPLVAVSAAHGYNLRVLKENLVKNLPFLTQTDQQKETALKLSVLGRPNVGKSSLVNLMFGDKKQIVSSIPGTTRDCVDLVVEFQGKKYVLIDTPGVRRKSNIDTKLEQFSVHRALKTVRRSDVVFLVIDAVEGVCHQDKKLISFLQKEYVPFIVVVNKIDLLSKEELKMLRDNVFYELRFCNYVPVVFTSTLTQKGIDKLIPLAETLWDRLNIRVPTSELNKLLREVQHQRQHPMVKGKRIKFYYVTQTDMCPPEFVFFVNVPMSIKPAYKKFLENKIRELFDLTMVPIKIYFRARS